MTFRQAAAVSAPRTTTLTGWGRAQRAVASVVVPTADDDLAAQVAACPGLLVARGAGCSYGDAALPTGRPTTVVDTTHRTRVLDVDLEDGLVVVQSGATLADVQALVVPHGWTLPVLPGTARVTVGGAVASDVHAKNQPGAVTFGHHVRWLTLVRADGTSLRLAPDHRPEAFWATVGGMGLTGLVDLVCLRLHRIGSSMMVSTRRRTDELAETLEALEQRAHEQAGDPDEHAVAWVDASAGARAGRAIIESAHPLGAESAPVAGAGGSRHGSGYPLGGRAVRRSLPGPGVVGRTSIRAANRARWRLGARPAERVAGIARTLHPLDRAGAWPAAFGSAGLVQYQLVVPPEASAVVGEVLGVLERADCPPALATLKRFTSTPESLLGFAVPGWALALDFPARWSGLESALADLDALVAGSGGRVYLTKDGRLRPQTVQRMYPDLSRWRHERAVLDPDCRWVSSLGARTGLVDVPAVRR
ncbi:MAG: FAD-binding oxidoreductase [Angustibacter sp.]